MDSNNRQPPRPSCYPCSHLTFQIIFALSLVKLCVYLNKIYQDVNAVKTYYTEQAVSYVLISLASLILPSLIYSLYLSCSASLKTTPVTPINEIEGSHSRINQCFQGLLLIPWQIKRHLDSLYFTCQKLCPLQQVNPTDQETISFLKRKADVLEFFENLYAGFLQILLQLYLLSLRFNSTDEKSDNLFLLGEVIGSALSVVSLLIAVRRRDDGMFTAAVSFIGWVSMFTSRSVVFALSVASFGWLFLVFACLHVVTFTIWVYRIALESHQNVNMQQGTERRKPSILFTFFLFGLPSLLLWPFMFQLKEHRRPLKFLMIVTMENVILLLACYGLARYEERQLNLHSILLVIITTLVSVVFLSLYLLCKPSLTDQVALHDMYYTSTESFGIYFEFCKILFNLQVSDQLRLELQQIRSEIV